MTSWFDIVVLSIVEGITEFLPVSSTGHMIITERLLRLERTPELDAFLVIVQIGAILAVTTVFWGTLKRWLRSWMALVVRSMGAQNPGDDIDNRSQSLAIACAVIPFGLLGFLLHKQVKELFSVTSVAWALITGGILIFVSEFMFRKKAHEAKPVRSFNFLDAMILGCGQCLALWPGFSRSAATMITGRFRGFSQDAAAELSFLIGLPTLVGAAGYEAIKEFRNLDSTWFGYLGVGIVVSWIVAVIFVKGFILFLKRYTLNVFAIYRIIVGVLLLYFFARG
jgi:undecaprenyl-diphosphatase